MVRIEVSRRSGRLDLRLIGFSIEETQVAGTGDSEATSVLTPIVRLSLKDAQQLRDAIDVAISKISTPKPQ